MLPHIEGLWVDENEREAYGAIARELHRQIEDASRELGRSAVFAYVPPDKQGMAGHLKRNDYKRIELELWGKSLGEEQEKE